MPLIVGKSAGAMNKNIAELVNANKSKPENEKRPLKQIVAIAFSEKRKAQKEEK